MWLVLLTGGMLLRMSGMASGQDDPVFREPDGDGVQRVTIILDSNAFTPNYLQLHAGVPVDIRLENQSWFIPHSFIIDSSLPDIQRHVNLGAGEHVTVRFLPEAPGTYRFYCDKQLLFFPSHRAKGMEGRLEVR